MKPLLGESASELRKLFVNFEENLMAIEALGVQTKTSDFIWIRILSERLDQESRRQWEIDYPGKELQTLDQLREFINKRVQALEASNSGGKGQRIKYASNQSGKTFKMQKNRAHASQNYKTTAENCPCCSEAQKIYACKKFAKMDIKDRRSLVYSSKLCFNCLCPGHVTKDCK